MLHWKLPTDQVTRVDLLWGWIDFASVHSACIHIFFFQLSESGIVQRGTQRLLIRATRATTRAQHTPMCVLLSEYIHVIISARHKRSHHKKAVAICAANRNHRRRRGVGGFNANEQNNWSARVALDLSAAVLLINWRLCTCGWWWMGCVRAAPSCTHYVIITGPIN